MRFFDTNILVYAVSDQDARKRAIAQELISHALTVNFDGCISTQVITEFCNVLSSRLKVPKERIDRYLDGFRDLWRGDVTFDLSRNALAIKKEYGLSYYDALIISSAEKFGCHEIITEDLNSGQEYRGMVAVNPFERGDERGHLDGLTA